MYINYNENKERKLVDVLKETFGIGNKTAEHLIAALECDSSCKVKELTDYKKRRLDYITTNAVIITNKLIKRDYENMNKLKKKKNYKSIRHSYKLPANGQNTHNNAKTNKNKKKKDS